MAGAIVPDLPVDEAEEWIARLRASTGVAPVQLAAPGTSRRPARADRGGVAGFVYCVATYGVTGARDELARDGATSSCDASDP